MNLAENLDGTARAGGPVLEVRDLAVTYGGVVQALRGVSLTVDEGAVVALLGSNGAGKTTLLRTLSGTLRLHRGRVERGEVRLPRRATSRAATPPACVASGLVQVPEGRRIFTRLTVEENLRAGGLAVRDRGRRSRPTTSASTRCSRSSPTGAPSEPACSPAVSSRCSRWAAA